MSNPFPSLGAALIRLLVTALLLTMLGATPAAAKIYELRTYHAAEGKLEALQARFRDHTVGLFAKHGLEVVGFWVPQEQPEGKPKQLIYLLAFESKEQRQAAWGAFVADPVWKKVRAESIQGGDLLVGIDSVMLDPTDYSPLE